MVKKRILTDEESRPIAVQIDYEDWLEIERRLGEKSETTRSRFSELLKKTSGKWKREDGLGYQTKLREEWNGSSGS